MDPGPGGNGGGATRLAAGVLAALAVLSPGPLASQDSLPLRPGDRVRLTLPRLPARTAPRHVTGSLVALREQAVSIRDGGDTLTFALDSVIALEVSRGRESRERTTALVGAALGLIAGLAISQIPHPAAEDPTTGEVVAVTIVGGFIGTAAGVLIGLQLKTDRWALVPLSRR